MKLGLGIKPFKDYWLNCYFNMIFSILTTLDPSYKLAAFINDYSYEISELETPTKTKFNNLVIKPMISLSTNYLNELFSPSQSINFKYDENCIDYLKNLVRKKEFVLVGVDLFYWIPNSICWNRHHWEHYSLINGFDDEKKIFYVLDENISGYDEHEIPEERFLNAVRSSPLEPHGYINKISNNITPYIFSINDVAYNAKRLKDELKVIKTSLWQLSDEDFDAGHMCDLISMYIFQIINRQKANEFLFHVIQNELHNMEFITLIEQYSLILQDGWTLVKNKLVKAYFCDDRESKIIDINKRCEALFLKEYEMWDAFLFYITK